VGAALGASLGAAGYAAGIGAALLAFGGLPRLRRRFTGPR
jgi:hypothetical protein